MTYLEYRAALAALTTEHRTKVAALAALYNDPAARQAANEAKTARARGARAAYSLEREAQKYLSMWDANPRLFGPERGYYEARLESATIAERTEMRRACELSRGAYTYLEGGLLFQVTKIVTE